MARSLKKRRRCRVHWGGSRWACCRCDLFFEDNPMDRTTCGKCGHPRCKPFVSRPQKPPSLWVQIRDGVSL